MYHENVNNARLQPAVVLASHPEDHPVPDATSYPGLVIETLGADAPWTEHEADAPVLTDINIDLPAVALSLEAATANELHAASLDAPAALAALERLDAASRELAACRAYKLDGWRAKASVLLALIPTGRDGQAIGGAADELALSLARDLLLA